MSPLVGTGGIFPFHNIGDQLAPRPARVWMARPVDPVYSISFPESLVDHDCGEKPYREHSIYFLSRSMVVE